MRNTFLHLVIAAAASAQILPPWNSVVGRNGERITVLVRPNGGRVDWAPDGTDRIAYDAADKNGHFNVWTMTPAGARQTCLTCGKPAFSANAGNPSWSPDGKYIIFQAQDPTLPPPTSRFGTPGGGFVNNIWIMAADGSNPRQITKVSNTNSAVLHPHFSHSGKKVLWSQRVGTGGQYGDWILVLGDFNGLNNPPVTNLRQLRPGGAGPYWVEPYGFSPDDQTLTFCSNDPSKTGDLDNCDIFTTDAATATSYVRLTRGAESGNHWNEHAHYWPGFAKYLLVEGSGLRGAIDWWIMNSDGSNQKQLTYFHDPKAPEYISDPTDPAMIFAAADESWSPDGKHFVGGVFFNGIHKVPGGGAIVRVDMPGQGIAVKPDTTRLSGGQKQQFSAVVIGSSNSAVTWSVTPATGSIDGNGLYTAPATVAASQNVTIVATSVADGTRFGATNLTLAPVAQSGQPLDAVAAR